MGEGAGGGEGCCCLFFIVLGFFWEYLTLPAYKSIEGRGKISRSEKALKWCGFQSAPYRSRPIHFLSLEGTTETKVISKRLPKIMINEKNEITINLRS